MQDEWTRLTAGKTFISDIGMEIPATIEGREALVGRYALWSPVTNSKSHQVIEVSASLDHLVKKYKVPQERVFVLVTGEGGQHG